MELRDRMNSILDKLGSRFKKCVNSRSGPNEVLNGKVW